MSNEDSFLFQGDQCKKGQDSGSHLKDDIINYCRGVSYLIS